jgi:glycosyltransferase involved in cell wall biosynthesis
MRHKTGEPLRVLLFEPYAHVLYGNQRDVLTIAKHGRAHGFEYTFIVPDGGVLADALRKLGETPIVHEPPTLLKIYGQKLHTGSLWFSLRVVAAVVRYNLSFLPLLGRLKPHVIQCHNLRSVLSVGFAAKLLRIPVVWYVKGDLGPPRLVRVAFALSARVLFLTGGLLTEPHAATLRKYGPRTEVIPTSIDLDDVLERVAGGRDPDQAESDARGIPAAGAGTCRFITVASLVPAKGIHVLLEAFGRLSKEVPGLELWVAGDSAEEGYKATLKQRVIDLGLETSVRFWGWRSDAPRLVHASDVLVLPSFTEGVPRSILEAMVLNKAVIGTSVGGVPDLVEPGRTGLLVPPGDEQALFEAMRLLATDVRLRTTLGANSRERVQRFSIPSRMDDLQTVYNQLIEAH